MTVDLKQLTQDDDAVSPDIGVILMVAITVILTAAFATLVLKIGDNLSTTAPQVSFTFDYTLGADRLGMSSTSNDGVLTITHSGGGTITAQNRYLRGANEADGDWSTVGSGNSEYSSGDDITVGSSIEINAVNANTVRVMFEDRNGGSSATLGRWDGPSAYSIQ